MPDMEHRFEVSGAFTVTGAVPAERYIGNIHTFKRGKKLIRLVVALEVEHEDGSISYVTSEKQMVKLGFSGLHYCDAHFTEVVDDLPFDS